MTTTAEENEELIRELNAAINAGEFDFLDEALADDYAEGPEALRTPEELKDELRALREIFPDYTEELRVLLAGENAAAGPDQPEWTDGQFVLAQFGVTGTHEGEYRGIEPTGEEVETAVVRQFRMEDGEITIWRSLMGDITLWRELGVDVDAFLDDISNYVE